MYFGLVCLFVLGGLQTKKNTHKNSPSTKVRTVNSLAKLFIQIQTCVQKNQKASHVRVTCGSILQATTFVCCNNGKVLEQKDLLQPVLDVVILLFPVTTRFGDQKGELEQRYLLQPVIYDVVCSTDSKVFGAEKKWNRSISYSLCYTCLACSNYSKPL